MMFMICSELPWQFCNSNSQSALRQECKVRFGGKFVHIRQLKYVKCHHVPIKCMKEVQLHDDRQELETNKGRNREQASEWESRVLLKKKK